MRRGGVAQIITGAAMCLASAVFLVLWYADVSPGWLPAVGELGPCSVNKRVVPCTRGDIADLEFVLQWVPAILLAAGALVLAVGVGSMPRRVRR